jgi:hypothetical protein
MRNVYDKPAVAPLTPVRPARRPGGHDEEPRRPPGDSGKGGDDDKRERMDDNPRTDGGKPGRSGGKGRFVDEFA